MAPRKVAGDEMQGGIRLSVIIPVAEEDMAWGELLPDLQRLRPEDEIIFSFAESAHYAEQKCPPGSASHTPLLTTEEHEVLALGYAAETDRTHRVTKGVNEFLLAHGLMLPCPVRTLVGPVGRARQLNAAAAIARGSFFWFVHSDSRISGQALLRLLNRLREHPRAVHFFDLEFLDDGPWAMKLNTLGAWWRSRLLRLPFGDQGFCLHREVFAQLGGFSEQVTYGEDHHFIWRVHQMGVPLCAVGEKIKTSARRYRARGWLATTLLYQRLTWQQALPEFLRWLKVRLM